jgi:hypothetical protein
MAIWPVSGTPWHASVGVEAEAAVQEVPLSVTTPLAVPRSA